MPPLILYPVTPLPSTYWNSFSNILQRILIRFFFKYSETSWISLEFFKLEYLFPIQIKSILYKTVSNIVRFKIISDLHIFVFLSVGARRYFCPPGKIPAGATAPARVPRMPPLSSLYVLSSAMLISTALFGLSPTIDDDGQQTIGRDSSDGHTSRFIGLCETSSDGGLHFDLSTHTWSGFNPWPSLQISPVKKYNLFFNL